MRKILLIVMATAIFGGFYFVNFSNTAEAGPGLIDTSWLPNCKVQTYQDKFYYSLGKHCLDNISVYGYYFIPKD